jgi:hypothetical protein
MTTTVRAVVLNTLRGVDHALGRWSSAVHVLVDVRTAMNLAVLRPMWRRLRRDPRVTLAFTAEDVAGVAAALDEDGLRGSLIPRAAASWKRWDLAMVADAWNHVPLRRCRRRIKFFHGVAGKYDLDRPRKLGASHLRGFDRVCFINEERRNNYVEAGVIGRDQAIVVGYPKIDDPLNGIWPRGAVHEWLGLPASASTVLYAPTFSTANSLHLAGMQIIDTLLQCGLNVIVKLHDRSMVPHPSYTVGVDWPSKLRRFENHPGFLLARAADIGPMLSAADVLVTDHSTVGFEFALLDRPIIVYDVPALKEAARIDDDKWWLLRSMAHVVDSPRALREAVRSALANPSALSDRRKRAHALFAYAGCALPRAMAAIYELLELDQPAAREATLAEARPS